MLHISFSHSLSVSTTTSTELTSLHSRKAVSKLRPADRGEAEATARGRLNWGKRGGCAVARKVCDVNPPLTNFVIVSEGRDSGDSLLCGAIECDEGEKERFISEFCIS